MDQRNDFVMARVFPSPCQEYSTPAEAAGEKEGEVDLAEVIKDWASAWGKFISNECDWALAGLPSQSARYD